MIKAVVEMPQGSYFKYEQDKLTGELHLDRMLNQPIPYNYGYIPETLCGDGDPLDVFILCNEPIYPLATVNIQIVGALKCIDNGDQDDKILAIIDGSYLAFPDMGTSIIKNYLETYKTGFQVLEQLNQEKAIELYLSTKVDYE